MAIREATGVWEGDLKSGTGKVRTQSGVLDATYTFASRFEDGTGTNPDELIGAALASCYSMFLANVLSEAGHTPDHVTSKAHVKLETTDDGPAIPRIDLVTTARVPGLDEAAFLEHAKNAKAGCPVAKTLAGTEIVLDASLD